MIGYLALARETFDVEFAESKFSNAKSVLLSLSPNAIGFQELITNDEGASKALSFFKVTPVTKFFFFKQPLLTLNFS